MKKYNYLILLFCVLVQLISAPMASASYIYHDKSIYHAGYPEQGPISEQSFTFEELNRPNIRLRGVNASAGVDFSNRIDHIITDLELDFSFTNSPSLLSNLSHIKVYLNEEIMATVPIREFKKDQVINSIINHKIELNPHLVKDFNTIRFQLIGHYTMECEDPFHSSIWADISRTSRISYTQQQLPLESQLSQLPEPFFDRRDYSTLDLPFVFSSTPDENTLHAGAIVSSWFGAMAQWRGAQFPTNYNTLPSKHSVVFATNDNKPAFLKDYPDATGPTVEIIANPEHRYQKMLLILGRDSADLRTAAEGLALGLPMMTGRHALIEKVSFINERQPYDAPRWLRSDRAVTFGELIEYPTQLQVNGYSGAPVKLSVQLPPDLFTWQKDGLPIDLRYRYTPPTDKGVSRLNMAINDEFIQGYKLNPAEYKGLAVEDIKVPLLSTDETDKDRYFNVPGFKVDIKNDVSFHFLFSTEKEGFCTTATPEGTVAAIDDGSTIDISDYHHYIAMPNLHAYAQSGFPFTKYADLSETLVVIPNSPSRSEVQTLLTAMGHFGQTTGHPVFKVQIKKATDTLEYGDKEILLLGSHHNFIKDLPSESNISALINQSAREIKRAIYANPTAKYVQDEPLVDSHVSLQSVGEIAGFVSFQSPTHTDRTVVAIMAAHSTDLHLIDSALTQGGKLAEIQGTATIINQHQVHQSYLGDRYYVGSLPLHQLIWFHLADHPVLLAFLSLFILLLLSFILWRVLTSLARKRLAQGD